MTEQNEQKRDKRYWEKQALRKSFEDELLTTRLDLEEDSISWMVSLAKISYGNSEGFDFISEQYGLTSRKANIYKSLCSFDFKEMDPFFNALDQDIPKEVCQCMSKLILKDINSLNELIGYKMKTHTKGKGTSRTLHSIMSAKTGFIDEEQENEFRQLQNTISSMFKAIDDESMPETIMDTLSR